MAKVLEEFPVRQIGNARYPWNEWTDGQVWSVKKGEDFTCNSHGLGLYEMAKSRGLKVRVHHPKNDKDTVIFQFYSENTTTV